MYPGFRPECEESDESDEEEVADEHLLSASMADFVCKKEFLMRVSKESGDLEYFEVSLWGVCMSIIYIYV